MGWFKSKKPSAADIDVSVSAERRRLSKYVPSGHLSDADVERGTAAYRAHLKTLKKAGKLRRAGTDGYSHTADAPGPSDGPY